MIAPHQWARRIEQNEFGKGELRRKLSMFFVPSSPMKVFKVKGKGKITREPEWKRMIFKSNPRPDMRGRLGQPGKLLQRHENTYGNISTPRILKCGLQDFVLTAYTLG